MRFLAWIRRFGSVSAAIAILAGCAGQPAGQPMDVASTAADRRMLVRPGRSGFVVAAPRHWRCRTAVIAREIAQHTGFGLVVAPGASPRRRLVARRGVRARGGRSGPGPASLLRRDPRERSARRAPDRWTSPRSAWTPSSALRLRALAELILDAHLRANPRDRAPDGPGRGRRRDRSRRERLARRHPALRPERALQIELPRCPAPTGARCTVPSSPTSSPRPPHCPPGADGDRRAARLHRRRDAPGGSARDPRARSARRHAHGKRRPRRRRAHRGSAARPRAAAARGPRGDRVRQGRQRRRLASSSRAGSSGPAIASTVFLLARPTSCGATPPTMLTRARQRGIRPRVVEDEPALARALAGADLVVDAILGTGARGEPAPLTRARDRGHQCQRPTGRGARRALRAAGGR